MHELIVEVVKYGASRGSALAIAGHVRRHGWKFRRIGVDQRGVSSSMPSICMSGAVDLPRFSGEGLAQLAAIFSN
jgi:hypothetical protein